VTDAATLRFPVRELMDSNTPLRLSAGQPGRFVVIEGTARDWTRVDAAVLTVRDLAAITVGVCRASAAHRVPEAILACDLRVLVGSVSDDPAWNVATPSEEEYERWLNEIVLAARARPLTAAVAARAICVSSRLAPEDAVAVEAFAYSTLQGGDEARTWLSKRS
jgi:hypothetical protein